MNQAHIHLMINHLPVIGLLVAVGVLAYAILRQSEQATRLGIWLVLIAAFSAVPAYFTGEGAEEVVEHMPGISEALIEEHEEQAEVGFILSQITGLLALATVLSLRKSDRFLRLGSRITLVAGVVSFIAMGLVANTGGKINHPELLESAPQTKSDATQYDEDDDDD